MKTLTSLALAAFMMMGTAQASSILTLETRTWAICDKQEVAESIGKVYEEYGAETAFWTWEQATKHDLCFYRTEAMTPIETVFRTRDLSVVKVRGDDGTDYYWVTLETIKEN